MCDINSMAADDSDWTRRLSTVDHLIKVASFVKELNNYFQYKNELIQTS